MKHIILSAALAAFSLCASAQTPKYLDNNAPLEERVQDALSRMTVHEKVDILHAHGKFWSGGVPRLGIKGLWHSDGPHGARAEVDWNNWNNAGWTSDSCVAFPSLTCLAATWNPDLSRIYGENVAEEFAYRGKDILLGPGVNIMRNPLNGRNFEYMGEDPLLAGVMVVPYIQGAQSRGVACCLKHFAFNNHEVNRMDVNVNISERAVHEIYLPAFKRAVTEAGLWTIMGSYNRWLGDHCCTNDSLLNKILKRDWGFDGAVVSDWGGVHDTWQAAMGGMDIEMGSYTNGKTSDKSWGWHTYYLADPFEKLINEGKVPMSVLDDKAARVLRTIFRTAMNPNKVMGSMCSEQHYEVCRKIGAEGIVLMKNTPTPALLRKAGEGVSKSPLLPIDASRYKKILVVGENAVRNLQEGGGSSELKTKKDYLPLDELRAMYGDKIDFAQGYYSGRPQYASQERLDEARQQQLHDEAVEKAKQADLIIYVGGLNKNGGQDCEGADRKTYNLSFGQDKLIEDLAAVCPDIVVCTFGGSPFATPWIDRVPAMLHCWYLGSMAGCSLVDVLSGQVNPSGKLPVTFAREQQDWPCFANGEKGYPGVNREAYYDEGIYVGYRHFDTRGVKVAFPFGHGLSYTTFEYGKPTVSPASSDGSVTISVPVTNTGQREGAEVVQLYVGCDGKSKIDRPKKELRHFRKLHLAPGETKTAIFTLTPADAAYYDEQSHCFQTVPGQYRAYIAASSADVRQSVKIKF